MSTPAEQQKLMEMHEVVSKAAEELHVNRDTYAAVVRLAEGLEMILNYLER